MIKKIVLAYSGGLDTSVILKWLQNTYNSEVITYTSNLGQDLDKKQIIKKSVEKIFKVNVTKINTINIKGKFKLIRGRRSYKSGYKKAIVTLKKGQSIDLTTGI